MLREITTLKSVHHWECQQDLGHLDTADPQTDLLKVGCRAPVLLIYVLLSSEILQPKTGQNDPAKTQGRLWLGLLCRALSLTAIKIFLWSGRKPIIYSGLAVLLVESDFSKLSMLDFDELMNWHGDTCLRQGPAVDLTGSCQKAKDLLWLSVNKWQAFLFSSTPSFIGLIHIFAGDKWSFIQSPHQVSIVS